MNNTITTNTPMLTEFMLKDMNLQQQIKGETADASTMSTIFGELKELGQRALGEWNKEDEFVDWYVPIDWCWPFNPFNPMDRKLQWFLEHCVQDTYNFMTCPFYQLEGACKELLTSLQEAFWRHQPREMWCAVHAGEWNVSRKNIKFN